MVVGRPDPGRGIERPEIPRRGDRECGANTYDRAEHPSSKRGPRLIFGLRAQLAGQREQARPGQICSESPLDEHAESQCDSKQCGAAKAAEIIRSNQKVERETGKYCRMMGGEITVKSELGKGSSFTMCIPLHRIDQIEFLQNQKQELGEVQRAS